MKNPLLAATLACSLTLSSLPSLAAQEPGSELRIALITMGPGPEVWEHFGHNAIMVEDTVAGTNRWYNYGMFSFAQENFVLKFMQGRMEYWMEGRGGRADLAAYMSRQRWVKMQVLNLTNDEKLQLKAFLESNDTPQNRFYRYDYYADNCSTRIRDAIDDVLGGQISAQTEGDPTGTTLRFHTRRLTTSDPFVYAILNIALGPAVDKPIDRREEMFLPLATSEIFRDITLTRRDGSTVPLVQSERMLYESDRWQVDDRPPTWVTRFLLLGIVIALFIAVPGALATRSSLARAAFATVATGWAFLTGIAGTLLLGLWVATDHVVAYWNENLFILNPLPLLLAFLIPFVALRWEGAAQKAQKISVAMALLIIAGFALQVLPGLDQVNGELYALFLPPMVALGLSTVRLSWWVFDS